MINDNKHARDAQIFKALCDEKRLAVLELLRDGEKCACVLIENTNIAQSALSYHMKILKDAEIVVCRHDGKFCHYSLSESGCSIALSRLASITTENENKSCSCEKNQCANC